MKKKLTWIHMNKIIIGLLLLLIVVVSTTNKTSLEGPPCGGFTATAAVSITPDTIINIYIIWITYYVSNRSFHNSI